MKASMIRFAVILFAIAAIVSACTLGQTAVGGNFDPVLHDGHNHSHGVAKKREPIEVVPGVTIMPLYGNLGRHSMPITTVKLAQKYFDEGINLTYGFNHEEAIRSFSDAAKLDPDCAMCYWGIAYALGPNINAAMDPKAVPQAWDALQKAIELSPNASAREQAYIQALAQRYAADPAADRAALDKAYADAMRDLSRQYSDDLDAAVLFAEALMDLTPWNFWGKDGQPTEYTAEIVATLESVIGRNPKHPGALHYHIHAVEASQSPEDALPSARRLEGLVPGASHLAHMPSHIYWRTGNYQDALRINQSAVKVDLSQRAGGAPDQNVHSFYHLVYATHNVHFVFAAAQMSGQSDKAIKAANELITRVPADAYREIPALEDFRPMPLFALVRFGQWAAILSEAKPAEDLQYTTGIWHWARGMAYTRYGDYGSAEAELAALRAIEQSDAMNELVLMSFPKASTLLGIASRVLAGEIALAQGQHDAAIAQFEGAVRLQDELAYIEPPAWFYPVRQNLGAALLEAGRPAEAEAVYQEDLRQYPNNGWSLYGLNQSLLAQGKTEEAYHARLRFTNAWQHADVVLSSSRF